MALNLLDTEAYPKWMLHPAWWAVTNMLVSIYGIFFLNWRTEPLIFLFWMEVILSIAAALIRVMGAMQGKPFRETLIPKISILIFGFFMGIAFIMLTVAFTIKGWSDNWDGSGFQYIRWQMLILALNYAAAVFVYYFLNGQYKTASPIGELMSVFVRLLFLICLLMVITQHMMPKFPTLNQAQWTGGAIVGLKFMADWIFSRRYFTPRNTLETT
ncbi:MAG: hypothetical protein IPL65_08405 [Lewinellaceae bacterium]|nr:hypothetical protein [Lewinellaceae bacterium]